jgi:alkylation response protein AidB-like acyl-CoA dehydrogenase
MDFTLTETQEVIAQVAAGVLHPVDEGDDIAGWDALVSSELLSNFAPESVGGDHLGAAEAVQLFIAIGTKALDLPALGTLASMTVLDRYGEAAAADAYLPEIASGRALFALAIAEPAADGIEHGQTTAMPSGAGWLINGTKASVAFADRASRLLVTACLPDGLAGVFFVDPRQAGVSMTEEVATTGATRWTVELESVHIATSDALVNWDAAQALQRHALLYLAAQQVGCTRRALELAASYTSERKQFGRAIASFQAVASRLADAYVDLKALTWTVYDAADAMDRDRDDAPLAVATAKFWAAEAGHRIASTAQHVHGGIGVDMDYPVHRFFLRAKDIEFTLGGASAQLAAVWEHLEAQATS